MSAADHLAELFGLEGKVAVVTGATGTLGGVFARGLGLGGARLAVLARRQEGIDATLEELHGLGIVAIGIAADVLSRDELERACARVLEEFGRIDILVNAAGGNLPAATLPADSGVFGLSVEGFRDVVELNLLGIVLPSVIFGPKIEPGGSIVNISSAAAQRALSRVGGYGAAKAAVESFTRWLAVEAARTGAGVRVNAIAPGFFIGQQNRRLLLDPDGTLTPRGRAIVEHTPLARFGEPDELVSTLLWLCSPGAAFVTGVTIAVDGGFGASGGV